MKHNNELPNNNCGECPVWLAAGEIGGPNLAAARRDYCSKCDLWNLTDEECDAIAEKAYDNLVHSLIEAGGEIRELRTLLSRAYEQLLLLGYDSGFTNEEIHKLINDIKEYLEETKQ